MKKLTFLTLCCVLAMTLLSSCDDDDNDASIVGTWQGDKSEIKAFAGLPIAVYDKTDENFDEVVEFRSDGTIIIQANGTETHGTWNWAEENKKLTATIDFNNDFLDPTETYTIRELSAERLTLYLEKEGTFDDPTTGQSFSGSAKVTLYFTRM